MRTIRLIKRIAAKTGLDKRYRRHTIRRLGFQVNGGPFQGLVFNDRLLGPYPPHCQIVIGSYEKELHPVLEVLCKKPVQSVINIGTGIGYYAVGLARRMTTTVVTGFEKNNDTRKKCRELSQLNRVAERVRLQGNCTPETLQKTLSSEGLSFTLCDVEGNEQILLDPEPVPELLNSSILVELHETIEPGIGKLLKSRFQPSHKIKEIRQEERTIDDHPRPSRLEKSFPQLMVHLLLMERRSPDQSWLYLVPKKAPLS